MIKNYSGKKLTPKQWAAEMIFVDMEIVTSYYQERWESELEKMTEKEQAEIDKAVDKFHERIVKMIKKARGV